MAPPLRGGIIGCGFFAQFQIEGWRRMPEAELVAAADPDLDRAARAAPRAYSSAEEMLDREKLDFVDIATRPEWHGPLVRLAAERKVAAICQKPMAPSWEQCVAMVEAAEAAPIRFMIHENWRWQPWYRVAQAAIARGDIGRPVGYWFRTRKRDGLGSAPYPSQPYFSRMPRLLIYETIVHHIDTARFLFGEVASVAAWVRRINPRIIGEDQALLLLAHSDGVPGAIDGHRFADPIPDGPGLGESGFEGEDGVLTIPNSGDVLLGDRVVWKNDVTEGYRGDSVRATQQHFIACLLSGAPFESGGREYLKTVAVVEAAYRSVAERRTIEVA
ncbi:MAG: Gfo/Idh/MocA family protein [Bryobacteraceae bacterium]